MAGTTINGLNSVTSLTSQDEVPVWDAEASGEPTKKITAQNMAASVKTLGSLVNTSEMNNALAGKQNTLTFDTTPTTGSTNPVTSDGIATAIQQSTATVMGVDIPLVSNSVAINPGTVQAFSSGSIAAYKFVDLYFTIQGGHTNAVRLWPNYTEKKYKFGFFAWNDTDNAMRRVAVTFTSAGRYMDQIAVKYSYNDDAFADASNVLYLVKAVGYAW